MTPYYYLLCAIELLVVESGQESETKIERAMTDIIESVTQRFEKRDLEQVERSLKQLKERGSFEVMREPWTYGGDYPLTACILSYIHGEINARI